MATQEYYLNNREACIKRARQWALNHPDERKEIRIRWERNNPDKLKINQANYRKKTPHKYLYCNAKRRARQRNIEFTIELSDVQIPDKCPLLGIPIDSYDKWQGSHPSLDRIDSSKGYIKGNVMVISHRANMLKNNSTADELLCLSINLGKLTGELT